MSVDRRTRRYLFFFLSYSRKSYLEGGWWVRKVVGTPVFCLPWQRTGCTIITVQFPAPSDMLGGRRKGLRAKCPPACFQKKQQVRRQHARTLPWCAAAWLRSAPAGSCRGPPRGYPARPVGPVCAIDSGTGRRGMQSKQTHSMRGHHSHSTAHRGSVQHPYSSAGETQTPHTRTASPARVPGAHPQGY